MSEFEYYSGADDPVVETPGWSGRATVLDIDLTQVEANVAAIKELVGPRCEVMAVVKANAYGLGAVWIAQAALAGGATRLGVACVDEGIELRKAHFTCPILVMAYAAPSEAKAAVEYGLALAIHRPATAEALELAASAHGAPLSSVPVHIKVDTGLGRYGCLPSECLPLAQFIQHRPHLRLEGMMTHFADAEAEDHTFAREQLGQFQRVLRQLEVQGIEFGMAHAANSAATVTLPESRFDMVRIGIMLGGHYPSVTSMKGVQVKPAVTWRSRLARVFTVAPGGSVGYGRAWMARDVATVGLVPLGYGDGYRRAFFNRGAMLVRGQRCPLIGRVSMDQVTIDLTAAGDAEEGDEVVLCGRQAEGFIGADELGQWAGTNSYEILTGLAARMPRRYFREGELVGNCNLVGCAPGDDYVAAQGG